MSCKERDAAFDMIEQTPAHFHTTLNLGIVLQPSVKPVVWKDLNRDARTLIGNECSELAGIHVTASFVPRTYPEDLA